jgi:pimeloyl-ACP methyl ester carboxylesterase
MQPLAPFFREVGSGQGVVCLHANASNSTQWRALTEILGRRYHVLAADSYGAGKSPSWPTERPLSLRDEVELLEPVFARAGEPFSLVAHSYGAAVALIAAVKQPERIRALALYEPVLFSLLDAESQPPNDADGIRAAVADGVAALENHDPASAARCFIDYWMGPGSWDRMPQPRRDPIVATIINIGGWGNALLTESTPLEAFSHLDVPVLFMMGTDSPASSLGVARLLTRALPRAEVVRFEGLGHMGPVTHSEVVNEAICAFLERVTSSNESLA